MAAAWVARCRAALALAFALAAAPLRRRRPPPGAGAVAGEDEVKPEQAGAEGSSSTSSFAINLPPRGVVKVKDAHPPASLVCRRSFSSSPSIFCSESEQKKLAELQENTSFHFRDFDSSTFTLRRKCNCFFTSYLQLISRGAN